MHARATCALETRNSPPSRGGPANDTDTRQRKAPNTVPNAPRLATGRNIATNAANTPGRSAQRGSVSSHTECGGGVLSPGSLTAIPCSARWMRRPYALADPPSEPHCIGCLCRPRRRPNWPSRRHWARAALPLLYVDPRVDHPAIRSGDAKHAGPAPTRPDRRRSRQPGGRWVEKIADSSTPLSRRSRDLTRRAVAAASFCAACQATALQRSQNRDGAWRGWHAPMFISGRWQRGHPRGI